MVTYIRQHLNDRPRTAVAEHLGISMSTLYRYVRKLKGDRLMHRARRNPEWEDIVRKHYADMAGHEIERKFGIKTRPMRTYKAMFYLCKAYGYLTSDNDPFTLYFDQHTQRRPLDGGCGSERYYMDKYHIIFEPYE